MLEITHEIEEKYLTNKDFCPKCGATGIIINPLVHKKSPQVIFCKVNCPSCREDFFEMYKLIGLFTSLDKEMIEMGESTLGAEP